VPTLSQAVNAATNQIVDLTYDDVPCGCSPIRAAGSVKSIPGWQRPSIL
jgi:hypothetical protein